MTQACYIMKWTYRLTFNCTPNLDSNSSSIYDALRTHSPVFVSRCIRKRRHLNGFVSNERIPNRFSKTAYCAFHLMCVFCDLGLFLTHCSLFHITNLWNYWYYVHLYLLGCLLYKDWIEWCSIIEISRVLVDYDHQMRRNSFGRYSVLQSSTFFEATIYCVILAVKSTRLPWRQTAWYSPKPSSLLYDTTFDSFVFVNIH